LIIQEDDQPFNDFAFHSSDSHLVALASNDGAINIYRIPEGWGELENESPKPFASITTPEKKITTGGGRLLNIQFHPLAAEVVLTCTGNKDVKLWDLNSSSEKLPLPSVHKAAISTFTWNREGSLLATSAKDKELRIFDPRGNTEVAKVVTHNSPKGCRSIWLGKLDMILSTGFTPDSTREVSIFDPKMLAKGALDSIKLSVSSSYVMPFVDEDIGVVYLAGKGDGNIRVFEMTGTKPMFNETIEFKSSQPQAGLAQFPRKVMDVKECEVARFLKLTPSSGVIPLRFFTPRVKDKFQSDIYPDTWDNKPSMTADEWFEGKNAAPNTVNMESKFS